MVQHFKTGKWFIPIVTLIVLAGGIDSASAKPKEKSKPRNVIVLIADGCGGEQYTLARWFKGAPLTLDEILVGAVKTHIADSVVADSAPTATAYATGYRSSDKLIGVGPKGGTLSTVPEPPAAERYRPLATVLEGARLKGMATGIVATSRVSHATPAAYMAHVPSRSQEDSIMEQAVYQGVDVVFGGGGRYLLPKNMGGKRADGENLKSVLRTKGYIVAENGAEMNAFVTGRIFGMFAGDHMEPEIDRKEFAPKQPSLEEMTLKAIEILSGRSKARGFFLMVEGSEIDWADHGNDPSQLMSDLMQFDRAVGAALDFARKNGNTLVLALSDHNTGGMTIGNYGTSKTYSQLKLDQLLDPLRKMRLSAPGLLRKVGSEKTPEKVKSVVKAYWGLDITDDEAAAILSIAQKDKDDPHNGFGEVLTPRYTAIGWTTHGHTGGDVPLFAYGPKSPKGLLDGPEIGKVTAEALGIDLHRTTQRLFVEAQSAFKDGMVTIDKTDAENHVVRVEYQEKQAEMPVNKNLVRIDGVESELEGVVVYIPETDKAYVPLQAVHAILGKKGKRPSISK